MISLAQQTSQTPGKTATPALLPLLYVGADSAFADLLCYICGRDGLKVIQTQTSSEMLKLIRTQMPSLIVIDLPTPITSGLALLGTIRAVTHIPVIVIGPSIPDEEIALAFDRGADDFVGRPFNVLILMCRIKALLRRTQMTVVDGGERQPSLPQRSFKIHTGLFNVAAHEVVGADGTSVRLTRTEGVILQLLLQHQGGILSAEQIRQRISLDQSSADLRVVKTHIHHLRGKLARIFPAMRLIDTVPGLGYTFSPARHTEMIAAPSEQKIARHYVA